MIKRTCRAFFANIYLGVYRFMRYQLALLFVLFLFLPRPALHASEAEMEFILSVYRGSTDRFPVIHSGYAEFEEITFREGGDKEMADKIIANLLSEEDIKADPRAAKHRQALERSFWKGETKRRWKALFEGNSKSYKQHYTSEQHDTERDVWQFVSYNIVDNHSRANVKFIPGAFEAIVDNTPTPPFEFQHFGRVNGALARQLRNILSAYMDQKGHSVSVQEKKKVEEKIQELDLKFFLSGTAIYDENREAVVLEARRGNRIVERYWIDPDRGFICPLIQCFDVNQKLETEYKSSRYFLYEKSGLWFPEFFERMSTKDPLAGKTTRTFVLDKATFQLNHAVADQMFTLDIPEGTKVIDKRQSEEGIRYTAMDRGELSLAKGGLDLDKMKWLWREGDLSYFAKPPSPATQWLRGISVTLGVFFIALALFIKFRRYLGIKK